MTQFQPPLEHYTREVCVLGTPSSYILILCFFLSVCFTYIIIIIIMSCTLRFVERILYRKSPTISTSFLSSSAMLKRGVCFYPGTCANTPVICPPYVACINNTPPSSTLVCTPTSPKFLDSGQKPWTIEGVLVDNELITSRVRSTAR